jgi:hypothetical protein
MSTARSASRLSNTPYVVVWLIVVVVFAAVVPLRVQFGWDPEDMRQGKLISKAIKARDGSIDAGWRSGARLVSYTYGGPVIEIAGVADKPRQDAILSCIRELQQRRIVTRKVRVVFYHEIHVTRYTAKNVWGEKRTPGNVLRDVTLKTY